MRAACPRLVFFNMLDEFRQASERLFGKGLHVVSQIRSLAHDVRDEPLQQGVAARIVGKAATGKFNSLL